MSFKAFRKPNRYTVSKVSIRNKTLEKMFHLRTESTTESSSENTEDCRSSFSDSTSESDSAYSDSFTSSESYSSSKDDSDVLDNPCYLNRLVQKAAVLLDHKSLPVRVLPQTDVLAAPASPETDVLTAPSSPQTDVLTAPASPETDVLTAPASPETDVLAALASPETDVLTAPSSTCYEGEETASSYSDDFCSSSCPSTSPRSPKVMSATTVHDSRSSPKVMSAKTAHDSRSPKVTRAKKAHDSRSPKVTSAKTAHDSRSPKVTSAKTAHDSRSPKVTSAKTAHDSRSPKVMSAKTAHDSRSPKVMSTKTAHDSNFIHEMTLNSLNQGSWSQPPSIEYSNTPQNPKETDEKDSSFQSMDRFSFLNSHQSTNISTFPDVSSSLKCKLKVGNTTEWDNSCNETYRTSDAHLRLSRGSSVLFLYPRPDKVDMDEEEIQEMIHVPPQDDDTQLIVSKSRCDETRRDRTVHKRIILTK
ncbi:hypothetical protein BgiBS90_027289, partial [Biomphalaria glabrata]